MFDRDKYNEIWQTITRNKWRSRMTAFGVSWGVFMLVILMGIGSGLKNFMNSTTEGMSVNSAEISTFRTTMPYKGFKKGRIWNIHNDDLAALKREIAGIETVTPIVYGNWNPEDNVMRGRRKGAFTVMGFGADYMEVMPMKVSLGRWINDIDVEEARKVCVIGEKVLAEMYEAGENPIGTILQIDKINYTVIGVSEEVNEMMNFFGSVKEMIVMPYTSMQKKNKKERQVHSVVLKADDKTDIGTIAAEAERVLKQRNNVSPDDKGASYIYNYAENFSMFDDLMNGLTILLWIVGLGTLLSGVVGVSNIMLVTVKERTQEIGVRRALGATPMSITTQILSESTLLTTIAGVLGLMLGIGTLGIAGLFMTEYEFQLSFGLAVAALVIIIIFGMLAGYLPVKRALSIKAVEALQEE